jgi:hypothetical protein
MNLNSPNYFLGELMFTQIIVLVSISLSNLNGFTSIVDVSPKPKQSIVDLGGEGGGADNSGMIELCASRALSGNTCFYQNIHFK